MLFALRAEPRTFETVRNVAANAPGPSSPSNPGTLIKIVVKVVGIGLQLVMPNFTKQTFKNLARGGGFARLCVLLSIGVLAFFDVAE